jgi:hypothetical protein
VKLERIRTVLSSFVPTPVPASGKTVRAVGNRRVSAR